MQPPSLPQSAPSSRFSVRLGLTWLAILCTVVLAMWLQRERHEPEDASGTQQAQAEVAPIELESELTAKMIVALNWLRSASPALQPADILRNAEPLREGKGFSETLGYSVLVGAVEGWEPGIESAKALQPATDAERALRDATVSVLEQRASEAKTDAEAGDAEAGDAEAGDAEARDGQHAAGEEQRAAVLDKLGYIGRVACGDPAVVDEALRAGLVLMVAGLWYGVVFFSGIAVLVFVLIKLLKPSPAAASTLDEASRHRVALVLGETFAIWMGAFFLMNIAGAWIGGTLVESLGLDGAPGGVHLSLLVGAVSFASSLVALAYPRLRGVGGAELREALGLHCGRGLFREALQGVACYVAAVPLLVVGFIFFFLLTAIMRAITGETAEPSHPVTELYAGADALRIALVLLLASVVAPIVEEIMFRGALFGHLRATVAPRTRLLSIALAAVVSSAIFALIHPQGVLFAPALGGLAVGFCLFREMRGSLVAPMVAHGINNAVTLALGMSLMA